MKTSPNRWARRCRSSRSIRPGEVCRAIKNHRAGIDASGTVLVLPLPKGPVTIEAEWTLPNDVISAVGRRFAEKVKTRLHYELESVRDGIATSPWKRKCSRP